MHRPFRQFLAKIGLPVHGNERGITVYIGVHEPPPRLIVHHHAMKTLWGEVEPGLNTRMVHTHPRICADLGVARRQLGMHHHIGPDPESLRSTTWCGKIKNALQLAW